MKPTTIALIALGTVAAIALTVIIAKASAPKNNDGELIQLMSIIAEIYSA